jgi:ABC-type glycerol-3-phosphate transport system substrate-binding protein
MMRNKTLWIACFTLALAVTAYFPAFAQTTPTGAKLPNPPKSLKGMDIIVGNYWADYDTASYQPKNEVEERALEWRKKIQADYGFKMREKMVASWDEMPKVATTSIMAGKPAAHVFLLQPDWAMSLYKQSLLFPVNTNRVVNFTGKNQIIEWNKSVNDVFTFGKNTYAFQALGYGGSLHAAVVFFNKRLFREAGIDPELPYNLQKSGEWTWDRFLQICKQLTRDVNNDGIMDTYAMASDLATEIVDAFVGSNKAMYVDKDPKTGKLVNASIRPEFMEAFQFVLGMYKEGIMKPKPQGAPWDWYKSEFNDGRVAMRIEQEYVRQDIANMRDDWGMVMPPKGPRAKDYIVFTDENVMIIPSTYNRDQVDAILWAVQAWYAPVESNWRVALYPVFRDIRAVNETMVIIRDPSRQQWKYHLHVPGLNRGNLIWGMWNNTNEPAQMIEAVTQNWEVRILDANETN